MKTIKTHESRDSKSRKEAMVEKISLLPIGRLDDIEMALETLVGRCGGLYYLREQAKLAEEVAP